MDVNISGCEVWINFVDKIDALTTSLGSSDGRSKALLGRYFKKALPFFTAETREKFFEKIETTYGDLERNPTHSSVEVEAVVKRVLSELLSHIPKTELKTASRNSQNNCPSKSSGIAERQVDSGEHEIAHRKRKLPQVDVTVDVKCSKPLKSCVVEEATILKIGTSEKEGKDPERLENNFTPPRKSRISAEDNPDSMPKTGDSQNDFGNSVACNKPDKRISHEAPVCSVGADFDSNTAVHEDDDLKKSELNVKKSEPEVSEDEEIDENETPEQQRERLRRESYLNQLRKNLSRLEYDIRKYESAEMSLDDLNDVDNAYLRLEKCKAQAVKVYKKICEIEKTSQSLQREQFKALRFKSAAYEDLNAKVTELINRSIEPPDFNDVHSVVKVYNEQKLKFSNVQAVAEKIFSDIVKMFRKRRNKDYNDTFKNHLIDVDKELNEENLDELEEKLKKNKLLIQTEAQVLEDYANASQFSIIVSNVANITEIGDLKELFPDSLFVMKQPSVSGKYLLGFKSREQQVEVLRAASATPIVLFEKTLVVESHNALLELSSNENEDLNDDDEEESNESDSNSLESSGGNEPKVNREEFFSDSETEGDKNLDDSLVATPNQTPQSGSQGSDMKVTPNGSYEESRISENDLDLYRDKDKNDSDGIDANRSALSDQPKQLVSESAALSIDGGGDGMCSPPGKIVENLEKQSSNCSALIDTSQVKNGCIDVLDEILTAQPQINDSSIKGVCILRFSCIEIKTINWCNVWYVM